MSRVRSLARKIKKDQETIFAQERDRDPKPNQHEKKETNLTRLAGRIRERIVKMIKL